MICYPNAKINLGLRVISRRLDGFHNIDSFFLPIPLFDILEVKKSAINSKVNKISYSGFSLTDFNNDLVLQAYDLLDREFSLPKVKIHLHKNIPIFSGLGGGSSNAAYMLIMLNKLFNLKLTDKELISYAYKLGRDCPFFIINSFSHVMGRGDKITFKNNPLKDYHIVIIKPSISCSTTNIFSQISIKDSIDIFYPDTDNIHQWPNKLVNDLEAVVFSLYPELELIKDYLYASGACYASMTGSGASIYGLFQKKPINIKYENSWVFSSVLR